MPQGKQEGDPGSQVRQLGLPSGERGNSPRGVVESWVAQRGMIALSRRTPCRLLGSPARIPADRNGLLTSLPTSIEFRLPAVDPTLLV